MQVSVPVDFEKHFYYQQKFDRHIFKQELKEELKIYLFGEIFGHS